MGNIASVEGTYCVPAHFYHNVGEDESLPCVCLRLPLSSFEQSSLRDEDWHDLIDELDDDEQENEDTEHLVLEPLLGVLSIEERESDDKRAPNGKEDLGIYV